MRANGAITANRPVVWKVGVHQLSVFAKHLCESKQCMDGSVNDGHFRQGDELGIEMYTIPLTVSQRIIMMHTYSYFSLSPRCDRLAFQRLRIAA